MKLVVCQTCGSNDFKTVDGYKVCQYCGSKYVVEKDDVSAIKHSEIALDADVARLLKKCKAEPKNAKRYANLILDIDPTNQKALKYL